MTSLLGAVAFLTRLPVGSPALDDDRLARAVPWFAVVGGAIGLAVAGVYAAGHLVLPSPVAAALAIGAGVVLTGGLHEDGLADVADAAGGWTVADRRRILDDPRHGTYGGLALVLSVVVRVTALAALAPAAAVGAAVAAHALGRASAAGLMALGPVAPSGMAGSYARRLRGGHAAVAIVTGTALGSAGLRVWVGPAVALAVLAVLGTRRWARRHLEGVTGDVLGACEQLTETAVLVLAAALPRT